MEITSKDFLYSVFLHFGLVLIVTLLNPFTAIVRPDFEYAAVNIIELPPLGDPALIKGEMPEITIPEAVFKEEVATPIVTPESRTESYELEKEKEKPKPRRDTGYKDKARKGEADKQGGTDVSDQLGPGTRFGSVAIDNAGFNYPYFFVQAFGKIQRHWSNPVAANQPLSCVVYFQVIRSGSVLNPVIEKSSGIPAYDRACLRAVRVSSPLPPLPADFRDDIIGIHLEFPYEPR
jgi:TonB family protein